MEVSALQHSSGISGLHGPTPLLRLQSDERLIALTRRGQHAAFEVLCARYQSRLLAFCRHMLGSKEDAEDVLQEVYAAAFNAVLADEREINVRPWLYRIARNRSLNHLRRHSAQGQDSMDVHFAENGITTGDKVMRRESFRELISDVQDLPESQRTALLLREIDALSYEQIASAMETTVPSVKSLLVRARISLAEAAESRKLSCDEVRLELGEQAEGLIKLSNAARRHVRGCERCAAFKKQLKENNHALAMILPVAPLLLLKKVFLAKIGSTASAGGAHVASGAGASAAATGAAAGAAGAGAAATGGGFASGLLTAGAGALATKAAAGIAAAAIVTAGAVAADHAVAPAHHPSHAAEQAIAYVAPPAVAQERTQPATAGDEVLVQQRLLAAAHHRAALAHAAAAAAAAKAAATAAAAAAAKPVPAAATTTATAPTATPVTPPPAPAAPATQVTEVTTETTTLPTSATAPTQTTPTTTVTTPTSTTPAPEPPASGPQLPTAEPVTPPAGAPRTPSPESPTGSGGTAAP